MKIAIQTLGTRGDVQPYVALAKGLKANGHEALLAGPEQYESLALWNTREDMGRPGSLSARADA